MKTLQEKINVAIETKPAFGEPCNHCGWCCLTEVCPSGLVVLGSSQIPCPLLVEVGDKYFCSLANTAERKRIMGIGTGCDAITIEEQLEKLANGILPDITRSNGNER